MKRPRILHPATVVLCPVQNFLESPPVFVTMIRDYTCGTKHLVGQIHGGWTVNMLDTAMALAAQTTLIA